MERAMDISDFFPAKGAQRSGFESQVYQEWLCAPTRVTSHAL